MILLALAKTEKNTRPFEYKYPAHNHNIHSLATINYPTSPRRNSPTHSSHLNIQKISSLLFNQQARKSSAPENIERLFINNPKIFKDFFACRIVLAANHHHPKIFKDFFACRILLAAKHQYPGNIQRLSGQQQQQETAATRKSNQQQQPAKAINSSYQQQQPAKATSGSNQQQQPAAVTNYSDQQQQSTEQTSSAISIHPTSSTYTIIADLR